MRRPRGPRASAAARGRAAATADPNPLRDPNRAQRFALALFAFALVACAPLPPAPLAPAQSLLLDRLYFGRAVAGGGDVSEEDWRAFLRDSVTPRFPDGLTVWRAEGQWRAPDGALVRERSFVLELLHVGDAVSEQAVQSIRADYRTRFRQDAVLRVTAPVRVQF
jgi:hypothetical protein